MIELDKIYNEDCLEGMMRIPDGSIDCIICDLPYGTTQLEWDKIIPFEPLWEQYKRITKENAAIILFSSQPFTTDLICSNRKMFKYEIIWVKTQATGFFNAKKCPLRIHENILVFYNKLPTYNPQKTKKENASLHHVRKNSDYRKITGGFMGKVGLGKAETWKYEDDGTRYPTDVVYFSNWNGNLFGRKKATVSHPTRKPVDLIRYLVKTFSNEGDTILDNCIGGGTTAVACILEKRHFIGFELNKEYFDKACERIKEEQDVLRIF